MQLDVQVKIICSCSVLFRLSRNFLGYSETFQAIRKLSGPSGKYPNYLETFQTIRKVSRLSGIFPDHLENIWTIRKTFQAIWKLSGPSRKYPDHPENIRTIRKLSRLSGNFPAYPENIRTIWKLSRLSRIFGPSGKYPEYPETFQAIWKLFGPSWKYPDYPETFRTIRKFFQTVWKLPNAISRWFLGLCVTHSSKQSQKWFHCIQRVSVLGNLMSAEEVFSWLSRYNKGRVQKNWILIPYIFWGGGRQPVALVLSLSLSSPPSKLRFFAPKQTFSTYMVIFGHFDPFDAWP